MKERLPVFNFSALLKFLTPSKAMNIPPQQISDKTKNKTINIFTTLGIVRSVMKSEIRTSSGEG